jgi:steroid delta-isomerase
MATTEHITACVHAYIAGFSAGDAEAVVALFALDATVQDPIGSETLHGHEAIRGFYLRAMAMGAKLFLDGPIRAAANHAAFAFHAEVEAQGAHMRIDIIDVFAFDEAGSITSMRAFWSPENMVTIV